MSQTSYSFSPQKRARTFSQISNRSNRSQTFLQTAPTAITRCGPKREVGGSGVQRAGTAGTKNKKEIKIPYGWVESLLFPKLKFSLKNYGINLHHWNTYDYSGSATGNLESGDLKMLRGLPGRQYWFESWGLPLYYPSFKNIVGATNVTITMQSIQSVENLIWRAARAKWTDTVMDNAVGLPIEDAIGTPTATKQEDNDLLTHTHYPQGRANVKLNKAFIYNGGYQRHTFINNSNTQQWIEICECSPRDPKFDWHHLPRSTEHPQDNHFRPTLIGDLVLADYKDNAVENMSGDYATTSATDNVNDVDVKISSRCRRLNAMYKVSKPITICLAPGEQFVYTMDFPTFMFSDMSFAEHMLKPFDYQLQSGPTAYTGTITARPTSIPRFTKRLVARCWAELGHTNVEPLNSTKFTGTLQPVQVNLFHTMEEVHNVRFAPTINKMYQDIRYERDVNEGSFNLEVFDDENEDIEAVNV